MNLAFI